MAVLLAVWDCWQVTTSGRSPGGWDFFVSYTQVDRAWAEWIAWILEEDGHRVLIQAWDFVPGTSWVQGMQAGTRDAARTIAVLSPEYLDSVYGGAEWRAAWASDPEGTGRELLTVRVAKCNRPGLLAEWSGWMCSGWWSRGEGPSAGHGVGGGHGPSQAAGPPGFRVRDGRCRQPAARFPGVAADMEGPGAEP